MIPVFQSICRSGWDDGLPGDCVRACVASIFERPLLEVPHFVAGEVLNDEGKPCDWLSGLNLWLRREGYACRAAHRSFFKEVDCMMAWRKAREDVGIENSDPKDMLWLYDATEQPPYNYGYWIASVISENFAGATHAIVMEGGRPAHDPSPHGRRTAYQYVGEMLFYAEDLPRCRRAV